MVALVLAAWLAPDVARPEGALAAARAYLATQQLPSGELAGAPVVDTAEALAAIDDPGLRASLLFALAQAIPDNNEAALARLTALAASPFADPVAADALRSAAAGGALGLAPESAAPDALVLARAFQAFAADGTGTALAAALGALQQPDGSFGFADNPGDLALTAEVVRALAAAPEVPGAAPMVATARQWLAAQVASPSSATGAADIALTLLAAPLDAATGPGLVQALLAQQRPDGSFDGDVRATSLAIQALRVALPDLVLQAPLVMDEAPPAGGPYALDVRVWNRGRLPAPATSVAATVHDGAGAALLTTSAAVPALDPGAGATVSLDLGVQGLPGPRSVTATVNPDEAIAEATTANNVLSLRYRVVGPPNLVIEPADVAALPSPPALYETVDVTVRVRNTGEAVARDVHAEILLTEAAGGTLLASAVLNAVSPDMPRTVRARFVPRSLDPVTITARADAWNAIRESREDDNAASVTLTPRVPAEVLVDLFPVLLGPPVVKQGEAALVEYGVNGTVRRFGDFYPDARMWPFGGTEAVLYRGLPGYGSEIDRHAFEGFSLLGGTHAVSLPTSGWADGVHEFSVVVDPAGRIQETDETNNLAVRAITVQTADLPELWMDLSTLVTDPPAPVPPGEVTVHCALRNTGKQTAYDVPVQVQLAGVTPLVVPGIAPGESFDVAVTRVLAAGNYALAYNVDPSWAIPENTKLNNFASTTLPVGGALHVTSIATEPPAVPEKQPAEVLVTLANDILPPGALVRLTVKVTPAGTTAKKVVGEIDSASFPGPGQTASYRIPIVTDGLLGDTAAELMVLYSGGLTLETAPFALHVLNPDFVLTAEAIRLQPEGAPPGEPIAARVTVANTGSADAPASVKVYRGYPEQGDLAAGGMVNVPAGGSAALETGPFAAPAVAPHVLTVVVDEEQSWRERNEDDNRAARSSLKPPGALVVAFDETHGQGFTVSVNEGEPGSGGAAGAYSEWARVLEARGYTVRTLNPGDFSASKLAGVDVVVNALNDTPYTEAEEDVWRTFLGSGRGLLFVGEWGSDSWPPPWQDAEDRFLAMLGVTNAHASVSAPGLDCSAIWQGFNRGQGSLLDHPITAGVDDVAGNITGGFAGLPANAEVLLKTVAPYLPRPLVVAAAYEGLGGRVALVGDSNIFSATISHSSTTTCAGGIAPYALSGHRRFSVQLVDWLIGASAPVDYKPDLAFAGSALAVDRQVVTAGDVLAIAFTIRNIGGALSPSGAVVRLYDGDPATGTLLAEAPLDGLAVDGEQSFRFEWDTTRRAGDRVLTAVADAAGVVDELSERNNVVALPVQVRSAVDLRLDPSDVALRRGPDAALAVTVHNIGYADVGAGARLLVRDETVAGAQDLASVELPAIGARGSAAVTLPWRSLDRTLAHRLTAIADADRVLLDPNPDDNVAAVELTPPSLEVAAPLPGTVWGGVKEARWTARSDENPALGYFVALARDGESFTGLGATDSSILAFDTRAVPDGAYRLRVVASDGFLQTSREIPFEVRNAGQSVRVFGPAPGSGAATLPASGGTATVLLPAGSRVVGATALADATPERAVISAPVAQQTDVGLHQVSGGLHRYTVQWNGREYDLGLERSFDDGATWSTRTSLFGGLSPSSEGRVHRNRFGFHALVSSTTQGFVYSRSADGASWTSPVSVTTRGTPQGTVSDDGIAVVAIPAQLVTADPGGTQWSAPVDLPQMFWNRSLRAMVHGPWIHVVASDGARGIQYYRAPVGADLAAASSYQGPATLDASVSEQLRLFAADGALELAYQVFLVPFGNEIRLQRCDASADCSRTDAWLPSPIRVGAGSLPVPGRKGPGLQQLAWTFGHAFQIAVGLQGGQRWSPEAPSGIPVLAFPAHLATSGYTAVTGGDGYGTPVFERRPGLTPADLTIDAAADGTPELAQPGMAGAPSQLADFAAALNSYLATHGDGDDGTLDGLVAIPVAVGGRGAGKTVLRNLEIRYRTLDEVAGFAEPPLFSPGASPGVLDTTILSVKVPGTIAVMTPAGAVVRTLVGSPAAGRQVATFDGRDDGGAVLPSGRYLIGAPGWPVGELEIDDIPPTALLLAGGEGAYGGTVEVRGVATDSNWAGAPANFARYALEYSLDGATWTAVATGTMPVDGVLGRWDTRGLPEGSATLRLSAFDRAGNSASAVRTVTVSPGAPAPPVITSPTVAGKPVDSLAPAVTIAGAAEPGTTVMVYLDGTPIGTTPSDGAWSLAGVALPPGVATFTASASRNGLPSPRSLPVLVGRYQLSVAISAPARAPAGSPVEATVTVSRASVTATPLTVRVTALDEAGRAAAGLSVEPVDHVAPLPGWGETSWTVRIGTATALPGSYRLVAAVVAGGLLPASAEAPLALDPVATLAATLSADKAIYDALDAVALTGRIFNGGANLGTGPLTATIAVTRPAGGQSLLGPFLLASIPAGEWRAVPALFGSPPLEVGGYLADLEVRDQSGAVVATAATDFTVLPANGTSALLGWLLVTPTTYLPGDVLTASFTVENRGGDATVPVSVLLLSQATSAVVARADVTLDLPAGATGSGSVSLDTRGADGGTLLALLVGNGRGLAGQAVEPAPFRDLDPPLIAVSGFDDGEYRSGPVTPVVVVTDASPFTWQARLSGTPFESGTTVAPEGEYALEVQAQDVYGNASEARRSFTIDTTPPVIRVAGVFPGELAGVALAPTVSFEDLHLRATSLALDGRPFASGTEIALDGDYALVAFADDLAGNQATVTVPFTIDLTPPLILVQGVADGDLTRTTVFLSVSVREPHPASEIVLLDGGPWDGLPVSAEGDHLLEVRATDLAGNAAAASVRFAIDRTPPEIAIDGVMPDEVTRREVVPLVSATDLHPGTVEATLDGLPFASGTPISPEGEHDLWVRAVDAAGNAAERALHFAIDRTPPRIEVAGVSDGLLTRLPVTPTISVLDAHLASQATWLDGLPFGSGTTVSSEGDHLLRVEAIDRAGNAAAAEVRFAQDFTPPSITIAGVADGGTSFQPVTPTFQASDPHLAAVAATLDGQPFQSGTQVSANGTHVLVVTAEDGAGNQATRQVTFVVFVVEATLAVRLDEGPRVLVGLDCDGDPACPPRAAGFLIATLETAGIRHDLALDRDSLRDLLRTMRHNVRLLYKSASSETSTYEELREATFAGGGLVVVNAVPPDNLPKLAPALGSAAGGAIRVVGPVALVASALGPSRTLQVSGRGVVQRLEEATAVGTTAAGEVVLSIHSYGSGRSATFTFDPEANAGSAEVAELIVAAVRFAAAGARPAAVPGEPRFVDLEARLLSPGPVDFRLEVDVPAGLQVLEAPLAWRLDPPTWSFPLDGGESAVRSLVVSAAEAGLYHLAATLAFSFGGVHRQVAAASLEVSVPSSLPQILADAVSAVEAIPASGAEKAIKADALSNLAAVTLQPSRRRDADQSVLHVLHAIDDVLALSAPEAVAARPPLDALLRGLELLSLSVP